MSSNKPPDPKRVGILGGMGPAATVDLMAKVLAATSGVDARSKVTGMLKFADDLVRRHPDGSVWLVVAGGKAQFRGVGTVNGVAGYRFTLQAPSMIPLLTYLDDASTREKVWWAYNQRASSGEHDNRGHLLRILERDVDLGEDGRFVIRVAGPADDIDVGMVEGCSHPMGPLRLTDLVGLDVELAHRLAEQLDG